MRLRCIGFDIPNEFVIGYGLDYAERYRDLPYIATSAASRSTPTSSPGRHTPTGVSA